jgi:hypothetical protein
MSKIPIIAVTLVAALLSPLSAFAGKRGHRQYIDRHRSTGRARGTWNTKQRLDPATRGSDEHCNNRKHQSQPFPKEFHTANKCDSKECAGLSEIVAC